MKEVVFENGKLVLKKRKISQMEELFLIASKEHDKREMANRLQKESGFDFLYTQKDFLFVGDNEFETMNTYFGNGTSPSNDIGDGSASPSKTVKRRPDNNMLTLHTKNRPDGGKLGLIDTSVSSNPQKKYALLAQAAYMEGDKDKIGELLKQNKSLYGFKLDESLSSQKNSVFVNPNSGEVVISYIQGDKPR